jgi:hypothetical protein
LTGHPPDDSALVTLGVDAAAVGDSWVSAAAVGDAAADDTVLIAGLDWPDPMVVVVVCAWCVVCTCVVLWLVSLLTAQFHAF